MTGEGHQTLQDLLDGVKNAARDDKITVGDVIQEFGDRAITPFILVISLLLVSPISGVPGVPTVSAALIVTLSVQALFGRRRLWLPGWLLRRKLSAERVRNSVDWMRKPCAWVDRHSKKRLRFLTVGPMRWLTLIVCVLVPLTWPALELLPFFTSFGAGTIALFTLGLFTRDGLYVLAGYAAVGISLLITLLVIL